MDRLNLKAEERIILGKKVKRLRKDGILPGHVFGKKTESEAISVDGKIFLKTFKEAGATGIIDLKIGEDKTKPVMVREVQYDPVSGQPIHVDFYAVNLSEKVKVPVPLVLIGEEPESVHLGEAIVLQTLNEVEVEALPTDLVENLEIDITTLKNIDDSITLGELKYDREKLTLSLADEEVVVKLAPAVSEEMQELLEEQAAETEAAQEEAAAEEAAEAGESDSAEATSDEEGAEGETPSEEAGEPAAEGDNKDQEPS